MLRDDFPQKCSICNERDAVIFVKIVSGEKSESKGLCATCAVKYLEDKDAVKELDFVDEKLVSVIEEMKDLLAGIVANISAISVMMNAKGSVDESSLKCANCGHTYDNFKHTGYLGCPYCYASFADYISEFVFELERGTVHTGLRPKKYESLFKFKNEIRLLSNKLKRFVRDEEYEKAEVIKKKLERLVGNHNSGRPDEIC